MSASLTLDQASPRYGDTLSFTYTLPEHNPPKYPAIYVRAYQAGVLVYASGGYPIGAFSFKLGSVSWTGGAADAKATLVGADPERGHDKVLAEVDFSVLA